MGTHLQLQPGVASVYCTIVQQSLNGSEFYIRTFQELSGLTFGAARRCFDGVIVVGYMRKSEQPSLRLNPSDDDVLKDGDQIVALAATGRQSGWRKPQAFPVLYMRLAMLGRVCLQAWRA